MSAAGTDDDGNPFCTRRVRPGAFPFLFDRNAGILPACSADRQDASAATAETLVARLRANQWRGQIVGPHGSGKSALLATLLPLVERAGRQVLRLELHDGQRSLPREFWRGPELAACTLLIVDGYEQLNRWTRFRLERFCRRPRRTGSVSSVPGATGVPPGATGVPPVLRARHGQDARATRAIPDELETRPTGLLVTAHAPVGLPDLYRTAVDRELACRIVAELLRGYRPLVTAQDVADRFLRYGGNLRELLFDLYDLYEQRRHQA